MTKREARIQYVFSLYAYTKGRKWAPIIIVNAGKNRSTFSFVRRNIKGKEKGIIKPIWVNNKLRGFSFLILGRFKIS